MKEFLNQSEKFFRALTLSEMEKTRKVLGSGCATSLVEGLVVREAEECQEVMASSEKEGATEWSMKGI